MKTALTLTIALSLLLIGCDERKNPVAEANPSDVQTWLMKLESDAMKHCADFWKAPENAPVNELKVCESEKQRIATAMNSGGFSNSEVLAEDLELKAIWMTYTTKLAERIQKHKQTEKSRQEIRDVLGAVPLPNKKKQ